MSIHDLLEQHEASGELVLWRPIDVDEEPKRRLWLTKRAHAALQAFISISDAVRANELARDLSRFTAGGLLDLPLDLKRLKPPSEETWELKCRKPPPQYRLIGAFTEVDALVILHCESRDKLARPGGFGSAKKRAESEWKRLFGNLTRHTGIVIGDYVSSKTAPNGTRPVPE